jgi:hypothetical protein
MSSEIDLFPRIVLDDHRRAPGGRAAALARSSSANMISGRQAFIVQIKLRNRLLGHRYLNSSPKNKPERAQAATGLLT